MARTLVLPPGEPWDAALAEWLACLRDGGVAAFATDTVWGLGALARQDAAVERIHAIKGRGEDRPMACLVRDADMARGLAAHWDARVDRLARRHWPGALTVIVPTRGVPFPAAQRGVATLGVRVPARPSVLALLALAGEPLAATSANRSGQPELPDAAAVRGELGGKLDLIVDDRGPVEGTASTVLQWAGSSWSVLRQGSVRVLDDE